MGASAQEDEELQQLRQAFRMRRSFLLPSLSVQVCLLSLQVTLLAPLRPLLYCATVHGIAVVTFEWWAESVSNHETKSRLWLREYVSACACMLGYFICTSGSCPENEVLMNLASLVLTPLLAVYLSDDFGLATRCFLVAHYLAAFARSWGSLGGEGWQQLLGLLVFDVMLFRLGPTNAGAAKSRDLTASMCGTVSFLLNIICDGFFLLDADHNVVGVNPAAEACLGVSTEPGEACAVDKRFNDLFDLRVEGSAGSEGLRWGLFCSWCRRPDGKRVKLEMYTVPCRLTPEVICRLLDRRPTELLPRSAERSAYIRAIRIVDTQAEEKAAQAAAPKPVVAVEVQDRADHVAPTVPPHLPAGLTFPSPTSAGSKAPALAPLFFRSPWRFESGSSQESAPSSYKKVELPGRQVHDGIYVAETATGEFVAVKEISLAGMSRQRDFPLYLRAISREADTLKKIAWASPVVIRLCDCWLQNDFTKACLTTEWLPTSLEAVLTKARKDKLVSVAKQDARRWIAHMVAGVAAIHAAGFVHRDVKPSNIWLTDDLQRCKVAGLGISRPLRRRSVYGKPNSRGLPGLQQGSIFSLQSHADDEVESAVGARSDVSGFSDNSSMISGLTAFATLNGCNAYSSPEMLEDMRYSEQTDVFSIGCILLELLTLAPLDELNIGAQSETSPEEVAWSLIADARVSCFEAENVEVQSLSVNCTELPGLGISMLNLDPNLRPTMCEVVSRNARLQMYLPELIEESPRLQGVLLKERRKVHFSPGKWGQDVAGDIRPDEGSDSGSELAPAVA